MFSCVEISGVPASEFVPSGLVVGSCVASGLVVGSDVLGSAAGAQVQLPQ